MLIEQLRRAIAPKQHRESIEPGNDALQLDAFHQEDRNRRFRSPDAVEELVLKAERFLRHRLAYSSASRLSPRPSAFSLRCSAERSMPMNEAVREMLPEKRRIWIF